MVFLSSLPFSLSLFNISFTSHLLFSPSFSLCLSHHLPPAILSLLHRTPPQMQMSELVHPANKTFLTRWPRQLLHHHVNGAVCVRPSVQSIHICSISVYLFIHHIGIPFVYHPTRPSVHLFFPSFLSRSKKPKACIINNNNYDHRSTAQIQPTTARRNSISTAAGVDTWMDRSFTCIQRDGWDPLFKEALYSALILSHFNGWIDWMDGGIKTSDYGLTHNGQKDGRTDKQTSLFFSFLFPS